MKILQIKFYLKPFWHMKDQLWYVFCSKQFIINKYVKNINNTKALIKSILSIRYL